MLVSGRLIEKFSAWEGGDLRHEIPTSWPLTVSSMHICMHACMYITDSCTNVDYVLIHLILTAFLCQIYDSNLR